MNLSELYIKRLKKLANISETKESKLEYDEIHLPELTMKKKELIKYLKDVYKLEIKDNESE